MAARFARFHPVWTAPLVPVALATTAGIVADRFLRIPISACVAVALASLSSWLVFCRSPQQWLALIYLWIGGAALGAAYHHAYRHWLAPDDVSHFTDAEGQPALLRGTLASAPILISGKPADATRLFRTKEASRFVLRVSQKQDLASRAWTDVSGLVQVTLIGHVEELTVGDEIELVGRLALPQDALNASDFDYASFLGDQGIAATLTVLDSDEVSLLRRGWPTSLFGWLAVVRGWGQRTLAGQLSSQKTIAAALLLGEGSGMSGEDWDKYQRTGIVHVLAISGQHLVVLAAFLWCLSRALFIPRRWTALGVALALIGYGLLTGGQPPVMRSAWVIAASCLGLLIRRPVARANSFALGWIVVVLFNPSDVFNAGCQLSFLAVAFLIWGVGCWGEAFADWAEQPRLVVAGWGTPIWVMQRLNLSKNPLEEVLDETRPWHALTAWWLLRWLVGSYLVNLAVWLVVAPLVAANFHLVSPIALLLGPPLSLLTSLALLSGFAFLLLSWCMPLAWAFAQITQASLSGCEWLVQRGLNMPGAYFFVSDIPTWWLWIFYVGLLFGITTPVRWKYGRWLLSAASVWLSLGVLMVMLPHRPGEFRCTFVAVGHGGCTIVESPGGHVAVYDVGAQQGGEVTRRHVAPFLWSRGIRHIDEVILSHADLDHFNGVKELTERFTIGRVICTPSFAERTLPAMRETLEALEKRDVPMHIMPAGRSWEADGVLFEVLHPPPVGPVGKENARSLVLRVQYADWSILLTGDLEEAGLARVLSLPAPRIDVLMAPHHGSDFSNVPVLADWAKPKIVASCQKSPLNERTCVRMYEKRGIPFLGTWPHGTVTVRHDGSHAWVETYRTRLVLGPY